MPSSSFSYPFPCTQAPTPKFSSFLPPKSTPAMYGSRSQGKWMVSSVKEKDITKLREAGYLAREIDHRLSAKGQIIPTPEPHERVVFTPHFVRGLGFPLHPFIRGLMFYHGVDFHNLPPTPSSTSRHLLSCARPSSTFLPTSDYG